MIFVRVRKSESGISLLDPDPGPEIVKKGQFLMFKNFTIDQKQVANFQLVFIANTDRIFFSQFQNLSTFYITFENSAGYPNPQGYLSGSGIAFRMWIQVRDG